MYQVKVQHLSKSVLLKVVSLNYTRTTLSDSLNTTSNYFTQGDVACIINMNQEYVLNFNKS